MSRNGINIFHTCLRTGSYSSKFCQWRNAAFNILQFEENGRPFEDDFLNVILKIDVHSKNITLYDIYRRSDREAKRQTVRQGDRGVKTKYQLLNWVGLYLPQQVSQAYKHVCIRMRGNEHVAITKLLLKGITLFNEPVYVIPWPECVTDRQITISQCLVIANEVAKN